MKTDRELLELAARAAGYEFKFISLVDGAEHPFVKRGELWVDWLPLTDDGDALRLAVSIPACIVIDGDMKWCGVHLNGNRGKYDLVEPLSGDPAAATRRAIVRAAAAIGESIK